MTNGKSTAKLKPHRELRGSMLLTALTAAAVCLAVPAAAHADDFAAKLKKMEKVERFLGFVDRYLTAVKDPYSAVGLSAFGLKEFHKQRGQPSAAIPVLEKSLQGATEQKMRNILLFTMRHVYEDAQNPEKVAELTAQILKENIK